MCNLVPYRNLVKIRQLWFFCERGSRTCVFPIYIDRNYAICERNLKVVQRCIYMVCIYTLMPGDYDLLAITTWYLRGKYSQLTAMLICPELNSINKRHPAFFARIIQSGVFSSFMWTPPALLILKVVNPLALPILWKMGHTYHIIKNNFVCKNNTTWWRHGVENCMANELGHMTIIRPISSFKINSGHVTHWGKQNWPIGACAIRHLPFSLYEIKNGIIHIESIYISKEN